jgi:hypothetical protein
MPITEVVQTPAAAPSDVSLGVSSLPLSTLVVDAARRAASSSRWRRELRAASRAVDVDGESDDL